MEPKAHVDLVLHPPSWPMEGCVSRLRQVSGLGALAGQALCSIQSTTPPTVSSSRMGLPESM